MHATLDKEYDWNWYRIVRPTKNSIAHFDTVVGAMVAADFIEISSSEASTSSSDEGEEAEREGADSALQPHGQKRRVRLRRPNLSKSIENIEVKKNDAMAQKSRKRSRQRPSLSSCSSSDEEKARSNRHAHDAGENTDTCAEECIKSSVRRSNFSLCGKDSGNDMEGEDEEQEEQEEVDEQAGYEKMEPGGKGTRQTVRQGRKRISVAIRSASKRSQSHAKSPAGVSDAGSLDEEVGPPRRRSRTAMTGAPPASSSPAADSTSLFPSSTKKVPKMEAHARPSGSHVNALRLVFGKTPRPAPDKAFSTQAPSRPPRHNKEESTRGKSGALGAGSLWTEKHRPRKAADLSIPPKKVREVQQWLEGALGLVCEESGLRPGAHKGGGQKLLVVRGPAGVGKSAMVQVLAEALELPVLRWTEETPWESREDAKRKKWEGDEMAMGGGGRQYVSQAEGFRAFVRGAAYGPLEMAPSAKAGLDRSRDAGDPNACGDWADPGAEGRRQGPKGERKGEDVRRALLVMEEVPYHATGRAAAHFQAALASFLAASVHPAVVIFTEEHEDRAGSGALERLLTRPLLHAKGVRQIHINPATDGREGCWEGRGSLQKTEKAGRQTYQESPSSIFASRHRRCRHSYLSNAITLSAFLSPFYPSHACTPRAPANMRRILTHIASAEGLGPSRSEVEAIVACSRGDLRHAILTLQLQLQGSRAAPNAPPRALARSDASASSSHLLRQCTGGRKGEGGRGGEDKGGEGRGGRRVGRRREGEEAERKDTYMSSFHALGKVLHAKRLPESDESRKGEGDPRGRLSFVPEEVLKRCEMEAEGLSAFVQTHALALFGDVEELAEAMAFFADADVLLARVYSTAFVSAI